MLYLASTKIVEHWTAQVQCAMVAVKNKNTFFYAQYQRLLVRRGKKRAVVAVAHSMIIAIYHVLSGQPFVDLGANFYDQFSTEKKINSYLTKLKQLGWEPPSLNRGLDLCDIFCALLPCGFSR